MKKAIVLALVLVLALTGLKHGMEWGDSQADNSGQPAGPPEQNLHLEARAAVIIDSDTGEILYNRHGHNRMYPASTTKLLTALLVLEKCQPDEVILVGSELGLVPLQSSVAGLAAGQELTVEELLYALLLPSGNDAAYVLAVHVSRQENPDQGLSARSAAAGFVQLMNHKARQLEMRESHFVNPDGFHDPEHYSTAADLALLAEAAMQEPLIREIVATDIYTSGYRRDGRQLVWKNTNELMVKESPHYYSEATGIKTGHTEQAGYCLIASAVRDDCRLISVVLDSSETGVFQDTIDLFNYGFAYHR